MTAAGIAGDQNAIAGIQREQEAFASVASTLKAVVKIEMDALPLETSVDLKSAYKTCLDSLGKVGMAPQLPDVAAAPRPAQAAAAAGEGAGAGRGRARAVEPYAPRRELPHQLLHQRGLARILEPGHADDPVHAGNPAAIRRCRLMFKTALQLAPGACA